jgi:hypothetical protein
MWIFCYSFLPDISQIFIRQEGFNPNQHNFYRKSIQFAFSIKEWQGLVAAMTAYSAEKTKVKI